MKIATSLMPHNTYLSDFQFSTQSIGCRSIMKNQKKYNKGEIWAFINVSYYGNGIKLVEFIQGENVSRI